MDINVLRSIATVTSFAFFVGVLFWAFSRRNAAGFNEAAQLPFMDENAQQRAQEQS
jgi:cytochrome c oxidase cbb3-type subunit 4